jgi:hypothetical protein
MNKSLLIKFLPVLIILLFSFFGVKALFHPGFYTSHDGEHQVIRLYQFDKALKDDQFPVRWAGTSDNGYGYPLFIFSYQSPWFVGVPLVHLGFSLTDSVKGIFIIGYILSGMIMFLWLKEAYGVLPGFTGSLSYLWAPYRLSNIFVRASLGEASVFLFVPLVFWGIWKCKDESKGFLGIILIALGIAGVILSHLMGLIIFFIPILLWILVQSVGLKEKKKEYLSKSIFGLVLGFCLSAYYLLPAMLEKNLTQAPQLLTSYFQDHFVTIKQLIYSKWDYGFDFPGTVNDKMSFQVGITQWIIAAFLIIFVMYKLISKKTIQKEILFVLFIFGYSIVMMLDISKPIWEVISKYAYFDFPWRFLGLTVFVIAVGVSVFLSNIKRGKVLIVVCLIGIAMYTNRNHLNVNQYVTIPDKFYESSPSTSNSYDEYRPKTLDNNYVKEKRPRFQSANIEVKKETSKSNYLMVQGMNNLQNEKAKINISYYPGWEVKVNNVKQKDILGANGMIEVNIPKGDFTLEAKLKETPLRIFSNFISIFSFFLIILLGLKIIKK